LQQQNWLAAQNTKSISIKDWKHNWRLTLAHSFGHTHKRTHTHVHTHTHTNTHSHSHTRTHTHTHSRNLHTHSHTHTHTHTHVHTRTHTHTHSGTHASSKGRVSSFIFPLQSVLCIWALQSLAQLKIENKIKQICHKLEEYVFLADFEICFCPIEIHIETII